MESVVACPGINGAKHMVSTVRWLSQKIKVVHNNGNPVGIKLISDVSTGLSHPPPTTKTYCLLSNGPQFAHVEADVGKLRTSTWMSLDSRRATSFTPNTQPVSPHTHQVSDRQQSGDIIPHAVIHSLALLRMGIELTETCWALINGYCCT